MENQKLPEKELGIEFGRQADLSEALAMIVARHGRAEILRRIVALDDVLPTFEQFQATGRDVADVCEVVGFEWNEPGETRQYPGRVYAGGRLYIERLSDENSDAVWTLMLQNDEFVSENLEELERKLYAFGVEEGYRIELGEGAR